MTDWKFAINEDGTAEGWEDATLKLFKANPLNNLAREIIQNSLDAPTSNEEGIIVKFELIMIPREEIPDIDQLTTSLDACVRDKEFSQEKHYSEIKITIKVRGP